VTSALEHRTKADECRRQAERSTGLADKARWLLIAEEWLKANKHGTYEKRQAA
jgi:hypothetical protein